MMEILLFAAAIILIVATLLPLVRGTAWWIRIFDFPRLQIVLASLLVGGLSVVCFRPMDSGEWALLAALATAVALQLYKMLPYTPFFAKQSLDPTPGHDDRGTLRLLIANVLMSNNKAEALLAQARQHDPDIVLTVETDAQWEDRLRPLEQDYPFGVQCPLPNTYGMILRSRLRLVAPELMFLVEDDVPSVYTGLTLPSGEEVALYCVHPAPPRVQQHSAQRDAELVLIARQVARRKEPAVVAGDLNDVAWSHTTLLFQKIGRLLDPRVGRGMYNSFNANYPFLRFPLDHVFHTDDFRLLRLQRLDAFGSDHFPMLIELAYEPRQSDAHSPPPVNRTDRRQAREKVEQVTPE
jgi:endonuclease/exonuclease/phosphatase (EEP) superfamily protein YafD